MNVRNLKMDALDRHGLRAEQPSPGAVDEDKRVAVLTTIIDEMKELKATRPGVRESQRKSQRKVSSHCLGLQHNTGGYAEQASVGEPLAKSPLKERGQHFSSWNPLQSKSKKEALYEVVLGY